jgi:hypothetical protein
VGLVGASIRGEVCGYPAKSFDGDRLAVGPTPPGLEGVDSPLSCVERVTSMVASGGDIVAMKILRRLIALSTSLVVVADRRRRSFLSEPEILASALHSLIRDVNFAAGAAPVSATRRVESILRCGEVAACPVHTMHGGGEGVAVASGGGVDLS